MSTTTILVDYTDTQMLDYAPDGDFSMQNSPAEWLAIEATMVDDEPISAGTQYSETIEVDMEPHDEHDGEITEYEMADDALADVDYDGDTQFLDAEIEVEHPPQGMQSVPDIQLIPSNTGFVEQHPPTPAHYALSSPALADVSVVMAESPSFHDVAASSPLPETAAGFTAHSSPHAHDEVIPASVSELDSAAPGPPRPPVLPGEYIATPVENDAPAAVPPSVVDASTYEQAENAEHQVAGATVEYQNGAVSAEPGVASTEDLQHEEQHDVDHEEQKVVSDAASGSDSVENTPLEHNPDVPAPEAAEAPSEEAGEDADPHEISEGVYIDPPPAVLLSIASSSTSDICLFNHPPPKSRSQSPGESSSANSSVTLVLHEQPTLYYEPLAQVFTALRQEQIIYSSAELVDNELILEAYDLNLTVGEDNIYSAQVTIHDLNEIHDRLGLTGPLRLRLTSGSRFITRYQALREQIAQITLGTAEQGTASEQLPLTVESGEERPLTDPLPVPDVLENVANQPNHDGGQSDDAEEETIAGNDQEEDASSGEQAQDWSAETPEVVEQNTVGDTAESQEDSDNVGEHGLELTTAPVVQELDADEVHRNIDAEEGGDYAALETFPDDEEKLDDEELPEELGGDSLAEESELAEERLHEGTDETGIHPEIAVKGSEEDGDDEYDEQEENVEPVVVQADEALLAQENEDGADDATAHDSSVNSEEAEQLYDYDDADGENYTQEHYEPEDWDELEDPEAPEQSLVDDAASSKQSSETLSTLSKRSRDEDDDGYEEEDDPQGIATGSPGSKRIRTQ